MTYSWALFGRAMFFCCVYNFKDDCKHFVLITSMLSEARAAIVTIVEWILYGEELKWYFWGKNGCIQLSECFIKKRIFATYNYTLLQLNQQRQHNTVTKLKMFIQSIKAPWCFFIVFVSIFSFRIRQFFWSQLFWINQTHIFLFSTWLCSFD